MEKIIREAHFCIEEDYSAYLAFLIEDSIALISKARAWMKSTTSIGPETLGPFAPTTDTEHQ